MLYTSRTLTFPFQILLFLPFFDVAFAKGVHNIKQHIIMCHMVQFMLSYETLYTHWVMYLFFEQRHNLFCTPIC